MTDNEKVFNAVKLRIKDQQVAITPIVASKVSERLKKALGESNATLRTELLVGGLWCYIETYTKMAGSVFQQALFIGDGKFQAIQALKNQVSYIEDIL